jgi:hypothetical protein
MEVLQLPDAAAGRLCCQVPQVAFAGRIAVLAKTASWLLKNDWAMWQERH